MFIDSLVDANLWLEKIEKSPSGAIKTVKSSENISNVSTYLFRCYDRSNIINKLVMDNTEISIVN